MKTSLIALIAFILSCQLALVTCACPPGMYIANSQCKPCSPGNYCLNDESKPCPAGTINTDVGQTTCQACPKNYITNQQHTACIPCHYRTNEDLTFCLLPNTPMNALEITKVENHLTNITEGESNYFFKKIKFGNGQATELVTVQETFSLLVNKRLMIFASKLTGMPGKDNYQYVGSGVNTTLGIVGKAGTEEMYYFNVILMESIPRFANELFIQDFTTVIQAERPLMGMGKNIVSLSEHVETIIEFKNTIYMNDPLNFNLEFSDPSVEVYYSTNPDIQFPNPNNSFFVSYNSKSVSFQVRNPPTGMIRVAIYKKVNNGKAIVTISPIKK
ncbi:predicted protein [Naegleria gruberi]|uniref:Predicted protein n=1 Tax=Naegleria gruberi TaxID=5762 RepID=D2VXH6_NAEGR|nr:uncharacterized protein NAEGRDRAFT_81601 [Naegleria gruberi]EFC38442.1 predicted protein [Naegleria gruberi]|eukprot:XP_002671186.1 predicted protein [Naegleria gruberi strain NEG-M]